MKNISHQSLKLYLYSFILIPLIAFYLLYSFKGEFEVIKANTQKLNYANAVEYCTNEEGRLPTPNEIFLIYSYSLNPNLNFDFYWADEEKLKESSSQSLFNMSKGKSYSNKKVVKHGVMCVKDSPKQIYSLLIAFGLFIFLIYIWVKYLKRDKFIDLSLLSLLVISWLILGSYKLGSFEVPKTLWTSTDIGEMFVVDLKREREVSKIAYFQEIDKKGSFEISYFSKDRRWVTYDKVNKNKFQNSFKWQFLKDNIKTRFLKLRVKKAPVSLFELRFLEKNSPIKSFEIKTRRDKKDINKLFDEVNVPVKGGYYNNFYFDEIYHSRTGYEITKAIDPYDKVHPMLGKSLIALGISIFDMTPFGWRSMNFIFGIFLIIIMYYFGKNLFKSRFLGFFAGFLMLFDFMHLTQSRIGLIDTFGVFFILTAYYMLYMFIDRVKFKKPPTKYLFLSGVFLGLGISVKWSALFGMAGMGLIILYLLYKNIREKNLPYSTLKFFTLSFIFLLLIPLAIYTASFFSLFLKGDSLMDIVKLQQFMYNYHHGLTATHPYTSLWYMWPIITIPMGYLRETYHSLTSSINAMGNPAIWWMGIVAIFYTIFAFVKKRNIKAGIILIGFLSLFMPYAFIDRVMFIYHFYYATPFLMLAIVYMANDLIRKKLNYIYIIFGYMFIIVVLFTLFYPILTGIEVERTFVNEYMKWFTKWWM